MKNFYPAIVVTINLVALSCANLSAQGCWMERAGGVTADEAYSISLDDSSNTYTTGYFTSSANFGPFGLTASGISDIFITKTNSKGAYMWAQRAGGTGSDRALAIKTDAQGNSYITGYYYNSATFGTQTITSAGLQDVFVAKYNKDGKFKWAVSAGGTQSDVANAITIDNNGDVIITGQFAGTANFGSFILTSTNNNTNIFTAKLDSANGNFIWAKAGTGNHTDVGLGVASDASGNVYVTGQYSDTVNFDNPLVSGLSGAIFLVKYNSLGVEQWVTTAGAATNSVPKGIAVDNNSNILITGNFSGTLNFYASTTTTLTNIYSNGIFIAKYDKNANLLWSVSDGSSNPLNVNGISLDASGNPYLIGNFECILNSYADQYGQGTFNSVGYWDIFAAKYSSSNGAWQWSRQIGGHKNNYGYGIAVNTTGDIYTAGSFDQDMIIPITPLGGFLGYSAITVSYCNGKFCSDPYYSYFAQMYSGGNLDIYIAKPINLARQPYDFYSRKGNSCSRPVVGVCLSVNNLDTCLDSVRVCGSGVLSVVTNVCDTICPNYNYHWSTGSSATSIGVSVSGWVSVSQTTLDGCSASKDSIYVIIDAVPAQPTISDNVVVNTNATNAKPIRICNGPLILTGGNTGSYSYCWITPGGKKIDSLSITLTQGVDSGFYTFQVFDPYACANATNVWVAIDSALPLLQPDMKCLTCSNDTVYLCSGNGFDMVPYDKITNPGGSTALCIPPSSQVTNKWSVSGAITTYNKITYCPDMNAILPSDSGWYIITDSIIRSNPCATDMNVVTKSVYVKLYPEPVDTLRVTGIMKICPGNKTWIKVMGNGSNYLWSNSSTMDSINVGPGIYTVVSTDFNRNGCSSSKSKTVTVTAYPVPVINMMPTDGLICPADSMQLSTSSSDGNFQWMGPSGPLSSHLNSVYIKTAGNYYCIQTDSEGCTLLSNTVSVGVYTPPYLLASGNSIICPGDTAKVSVIAPSDAIIQWQSPLSGGSFTQNITAGGTYSALVTACGITTPCYVTVNMADPFATIINGAWASLCSAGDSVNLQAAPGMSTYKWNPGNISGRFMTTKNAGTYTLSVVDSNGCTVSSSIVVYAPLTDSVMLVNNEMCNGDNDGSISVGVNAGSGSYTYLWSPVSASTATVSGLTAGTYSVNITDGTGCMKQLTITITQASSLLKASAVAISHPTCNGMSNGSASATGTGGMPSYKFSWAPGGQTTQNVSGLSAGTYTVSVSDSSGCTKTSAVVITEPAVFNTMVASTPAICANTDGSITVSITGGISPYSYSWSPDTGSSNMLSNISAGTYRLTYTDSHGCFDSISATLGYKNNLAVIITGSDSACKGSIPELTVSGAETYAWSTGSTASFIYFSAITDTTIIVIGKSGICIDTARLQIGIYPTLQVNLLAPDSICEGKPAQLQAEVEGGKPAYNYTWNNGITNTGTSPFTVTPTVSTTYVLTVEDGCGYHVTLASTVTVVPDSKPTFVLKTDTVEVTETINFFNNSAGAVSSSWDFGDGSSSTETMPTHYYKNPGVYKVILTTDNGAGCTDTTSQDIYVVSTIRVPNVFTPNGDGVNDKFMVTISDAQCYEIKIFNRWGDVVYESNDITQGWNGLMHQSSEEAPGGAYYYTINYCDKQNARHSKDGYLQLIRGEGTK